MLHGMKTFQIKKKKAITLVELTLAIMLMSMIVLAGYSLELTMRRMSVAPRVEAQLLDELIPIMELIGKDFEFHSTGNFSNLPARVFGNPPGPGPRCDQGDDYGIEIRVGDAYNWKWQGYCWKGVAGANAYEFWYYPITTTPSTAHTVMGYGIYNFDFDLPNAVNRTRLSVEISTRQDPTNPIPNAVTNPEVILNSTFYARAVPGA